MTSWVTTSMQSRSPVGQGPAGFSYLGTRPLSPLQFSQDLGLGASASSSAQSSSGIYSDISAVISAIRAGSDTPTTVDVTRGSRSGNCSAAAASETP
jgi:hypothetical protein